MANHNHGQLGPATKPFMNNYTKLKITLTYAVSLKERNEYS